MDYGSCLQDDGAGGQVMTLACVPALIQNLINFAFGAVGVAAIIFIIIAGYKLINSKGDAKEMEGARQTLTYAIIGLLIVVLAAAVVNLIGVITGVNCITLLNQNFGNCQ